MAGLGLPQWFSGKESTCKGGATGNTGSAPALGRSLKEDMVTHPSILAWRTAWTEEPDRLQPTGSQRVGHDYSNLALT